jgi:hypothetical protein
MSTYYRTLLNQNNVVPPLPSSYLLDDYPGAYIAYSLDKISSTYTGSAIRVRRTSDNAEQDIGFDVNDNLDTTALLAFVGASNGVIVTWYDQSVSIKNAIQATFNRQPRIVTNGSLITRKGKPSIEFGINNQYDNLEMGGFTGVTQAEVFTVIEAISNGFTHWTTSTSFSALLYPFTDTVVYDGFGSTTRFTTGTPPVPLNQLNFYNINTATNLWQARINTNQYFSSITNTVNFPANVRLGSITALPRHYFSEFIVYPAVQTADRAAISLEIMTRYGI